MPHKEPVSDHSTVIHAPKFMAPKDAAKVKAGDFLCSEPWMPCWEPATHRQDTLKGVLLTCWGCGIVGESTRLDGVASDEERP